MSRAQTILQLAVASKKPLTLGAVIAAIERPEGTTEVQHSRRIAAQLFQLAESGKLLRKGSCRNYTYTPTAEALVDRRSLKKAAAPARAAAKKKPAAKPAPPARAKPAAAADPERNKFSLRPKGPPNLQRGERETVDEFLARGGRIQKLRPGECSHNTFPLSPREVADVTWRARQLQASARKGAANADLDDVDDDADAA